MNQLYSQPTYGITSGILFVRNCLRGCTILTQISIIIVVRVIVVVLLQGCHQKVGARDFPRLLSKEENRRKIEPKEALSCLIPRLLFVFIQQLKILVTTPYQQHDFKASSLRNKTERICGKLEIIFNSFKPLSLLFSAIGWIETYQTSNI